MARSFQSQTKFEKYLSVIKPWIAKKIIQYIGIEDEVVQRQIINYLEQQSQDIRRSDPKVVSIQIMGYLKKNTLPLMTELWNFLVDAEGQDSRIANQLLDSMKLEHQKKKQELSRLLERQKLLYQTLNMQKNKKKNKNQIIMDFKYVDIYSNGIFNFII